jgi:hypothetical protein
LNEEYRNETGIPLYIGVKDGVLLMGSLNEGALEVNPEIEWVGGESNGKSILRAQVNIELLASLLGSLFSSQPSETAELLNDLIEALDLEDLLSIRPGLFRALATLQEIKGLTLDMGDWESLDMSVLTGEVDYKKVDELARLSRRLESDED